MELATRYYFLSECCCLKFVVFIYGTPSLTRGRVCNLQCNQWPESHRTRNHTLLPHVRLPQPGGPGSRICIPQEQGGPVIPPGTESPLRRLLRLAGLRWRYSNPPPENHTDATELKRLMLFGETVTVCCENRTKHTSICIYTLCG
jgi:hypothetical protein